MAEKWHRYQWGKAEERDGCVQEEPGKVRRGAPRGFFEEARIALEEEYMENEV
jgi:hypothetical protein